MAGGASCLRRAASAQAAEGGEAGPAQGDGVPGRGGDRAGLLVPGEVVDGEPAGHRGLQRPGLDHRLVPGLLYPITQFTGAVGRVAVPGRRVTAARRSTAAAPAAPGAPGSGAAPAAPPASPAGPPPLPP